MANEIPFPLLSGQFVYTTINGKKVYYELTRQGRYFDLQYPYEIPPATTLSDLSIQNGTGSGAISVFRTKVPGLKEWVTWVDNDWLSVSWVIDSVRVNTLSGFSEPETKYTSPTGSSNFPKFTINNSAGNITFTLTNRNPINMIAGTLHILMYDYVIAPYNAIPSSATDITYISGEIS